jgi:phage-related minor tail protein
MGEAGPEAIMPLKRGRDGRLGVEGGGGVTNITYNVAAGVTRNELVTALQVLQSSMEARMTTMLRRQGIA